MKVDNESPWGGDFMGTSILVRRVHWHPQGPSQALGDEGIWITDDLNANKPGKEEGCEKKSDPSPIWLHPWVMEFSMSRYNFSCEMTGRQNAYWNEPVNWWQRKIGTLWWRTRRSEECHVSKAGLVAGNLETARGHTMDCEQVSKKLLT